MDPTASAADATSPSAGCGGADSAEGLESSAADERRSGRAGAAGLGLTRFELAFLSPEVRAEWPWAKGGGRNLGAIDALCVWESWRQTFPGLGGSDRRSV